MVEQLHCIASRGTDTVHCTDEVIILCLILLYGVLKDIGAVSENSSMPFPKSKRQKAVEWLLQIITI